MKQKMTAEELLARLHADPDYRVRANERAEAFRLKDEECARAETSITTELRAVGVPVNSVWDLVNTPNTYPQSLPILLEHLQRPYPDAVRDGIARAMAVPDARFAWSVLVKLYRQEQSSRTQQGLAVALSNIADNEVIRELIKLAGDSRLGVSRCLLLDALRRSPLSLARNALTNFLKDPLLQEEAEKILRQSTNSVGRTR